MVAVISNGTAILGLGNLGALASKPVMEGKAVLFKRFADVDSIDLEVDTEDVDEFVNCVRFLGPSFGGINLEDIKAPDCFIIESRLRELMDIPVFHDDQHGTAIIAAAGLINALHLTGRDMATTKLVCNGAGAAGIACIELIKTLGMKAENIILCDTKGVDLQGPQGGHEPVEVGARRRHRRRARSPTRWRAPTWSSACRPRARFTADMIKLDGGQADHLRHGQSRPGDHAGGSGGDPRRRDRGDRALGLSEPGQQRPRLPLHLPRRARRARDHHQRGDEGRGGACAGRARPRGRARRGRRRLSGRAAEIRPALHHPGAVRPAAALRDSGGGGARRRWIPASRASRSPTWPPTRSQLSARRDPIVGTLQRIFQRVRRDAEARRLRRGRGGADDPRGGVASSTTSSAPPS